MNFSQEIFVAAHRDIYSFGNYNDADSSGTRREVDIQFQNWQCRFVDFSSTPGSLL